MSIAQQRQDAERLCLSSIKSKSDAMRTLALGLAPSHFLHYGKLFSALLEESQKPDVTEDALWTSVMQSSMTNQIDVGLNISDLLRIEQHCPTSAFLTRNAKAVQAFAAKATALALLERAKEAIENDTTASKDTIVAELAKVRAGFSDIAAEDAGDAGDTNPYIDECIAKARNPQQFPRLKWWSPVVSREFMDIEEHEMVTLAARPACGKTILACNQVLYTAIKAATAAKQKDGANHPAIFINAEMNGGPLMERMALALGGANCIGASYSAVSNRVAALEELRTIRQSMLVYDNRASRRIEWIEAKVALLASIGRKPSILCIDYLQLLRPPAGMEKASRENQVAELSRRLKAISKDYKLPILLLAQLNRESEKENRAPRMSDLRESGAIEQDSDRILFLHRDDPDQQSRVILTQAKLRSGPCMVSRVCTLAGAIYRLTPE